MRVSTISIIFLLQAVAFTAGEQKLVSFGDFIEFSLGLQNACEDADTAESIASEFETCVGNLMGKDKVVFENFQSICGNKEDYLSCWETMNKDAMEQCGTDKQAVLPAVYQASLEAFCGNDDGVKKINDLKKALLSLKADVDVDCPEETGLHWMESCKSLLESMTSQDVCDRHAAIDQCLKKQTCNDIKFAVLLRQYYTDAREHLDC